MTTSPTECHTQSGTSAIALRKLGNLLRNKRKGFKCKIFYKKTPRQFKHTGILQYIFFNVSYNFNLMPARKI